MHDVLNLKHIMNYRKLTTIVFTRNTILEIILRTIIKNNNFKFVIL